jgi:hypothetical protein
MISRPALASSSSRGSKAHPRKCEESLILLVHRGTPWPRGSAMDRQ